MFEAGTESIRLLANEGLFDLAILTLCPSFSPAFRIEPIGVLRSSAFTSRRGAERLGARPSLEAIEATRFVMPVRIRGSELIDADDRCPIPAAGRDRGHECSTFGVAMRLAAATDQLVFGPDLAARDLLASGALVRVEHPALVLEEPLSLVVHADRVPARVHRLVKSTLQAELG